MGAIHLVRTHKGGGGGRGSSKCVHLRTRGGGVLMYVHIIKIKMCKFSGNELMTACCRYTWTIKQICFYWGTWYCHWMLTSFHVGKYLGFDHVFMYIFMFLGMYFIFFIHSSFCNINFWNPIFIYLFIYLFFLGGRVKFCRILAYVLNGWSR